MLDRVRKPQSRRVVEWSGIGRTTVAAMLEKSLYTGTCSINCSDLHKTIHTAEWRA